MCYLPGISDSVIFFFKKINEYLRKYLLYFILLLLVLIQLVFNLLHNFIVNYLLYLKFFNHERFI